MKKGTSGRLSRAREATLCVLGLLALGCSVPVAAALDETDANRVVVALEESGVSASKEPDPDAEGRWRVSVGREEASAAVAVMSRENLPPPNAPGVLDALGKGSIVPSRSAEQARLVAGTAGELEKSLRAVDGVLSARVHLAIPTSEPFARSDDKSEAPSASVLVRHRGATPPIAAADVQRLVAGAVPGLDPARVAVVSTPTPLPGRLPERELSRFGPITVTRASMLSLRLVVGAAVVVNLLLIALVLALWSRVRRAEQTLSESRAAESPAQ